MKISRLLQQLALSPLLVCLALTTFNAAAGASDEDAPRTSENAQILRGMLQQVETLHADFEQKVFDERGELQETLEGTLVLKRPHFLRWETSYPDHSVMVADGQSVWYLNSFVEQLSIFDQAQDLEQNPMLVILSSDDYAWSQFEVTQDDGFWVIREPDSGYAQVSLALAFDDNQHLKTLRVDDGQGQVSVFELRDVQLNLGAPRSTFSIDVPEGVEVDDQRGQSF